MWFIKNESTIVGARAFLLKDWMSISLCYQNLYLQLLCFCCFVYNLQLLDGVSRSTPLHETEYGCTIQRLR